MTAARDLLILNPNTSTGVSHLLAGAAQDAAARAGLGPVRVEVLTARFGAPYIACEASYAVAGHAVLDLWAAHRAPPARVAEPADPADPAGRTHPADPATSWQPPAPDAILIGCFGDPGLHALREVAGVPVTGLAEAAFREAACLGRYAVVTGGTRWAPMLQRLAAGLGLADGLRGIHTVAPSGAQLAADRPAAIALLTEACRAAVAQARARDGADALQALILGGAGLAGLAAEIQPALDLPLICSVEAGVRQAVGRPVRADTPAPAVRGFLCAWQGLSADMQAWQAWG
ncbi:MAG: hypothetical protein RIQ53_4755 [Pseudomonadota bacterium]|jgi:Asp/Glu/hydantoin racemase